MNSPRCCLMQALCWGCRRTWRQAVAVDQAVDASRVRCPRCDETMVWRIIGSTAAVEELHEVED